MIGKPNLFRFLIFVVIKLYKQPTSKAHFNNKKKIQRKSIHFLNSRQLHIGDVFHWPIEMYAIRATLIASRGNKSIVIDIYIYLFVAVVVVLLLYVAVGLHLQAESSHIYKYLYK